MFQISSFQVLLESTGVIGRQLKMEALLRGVPQLASSLGASADAAQHAAVAITTTDLVSKSAALEASCSPTVTLQDARRFHESCIRLVFVTQKEGNHCR